MAEEIDIFLSYASADLERVRPLVRSLEREGLIVWWDRKIHPGSSFDQAIEKALKAAKFVIVVWSEKSVISEWVKNEATEAHNRQILIPVLIDDVDIPLAFKRVQAAKLIGWLGDTNHPEYELLVEAIRLRFRLLQLQETSKLSSAGTAHLLASITGNLPGTEIDGSLGSNLANSPSEASFKSDHPRVVWHDQFGQRYEFYLLEASVLIGRADPHAGVFPAIDLTRFDKKTLVSRCHARIYASGMRFMIEDLNSIYGTMINNQRLRPGVPHVLVDGAEITVGKVKLTYYSGRDKGRRPTINIHEISNLLNLSPDLYAEDLSKYKFSNIRGNLFYSLRNINSLSISGAVEYEGGIELTCEKRLDDTSFLILQIKNVEEYSSASSDQLMVEEYSSASSDQLMKVLVNRQICLPYFEAHSNPGKPEYLYLKSGFYAYDLYDIVDSDLLSVKLMFRNTEHLHIEIRIFFAKSLEEHNTKPTVYLTTTQSQKLGSTELILFFPPFHIPDGFDILYLNDEVVPLDSKAVNILRYLAEHPNRVVTNDELVEKVWFNLVMIDNDMADNDALEKAVSRAISALGDSPGDAYYIEIHESGYRFIAPVELRLRIYI